jgi:UDP-glucuronate decarboxylase
MKKLNPLNKKRILVTGVSAVRSLPVFATIWVLTVLQGAGFVGSHLVDRLMLLGHDVICIDNFFTGTKANVSNWIGHPNFELIRYAFGCSIDGGNF